MGSDNEARLLIQSLVLTVASILVIAAALLLSLYRLGFNAGARAHADGKVVVTGSGVKEVERAK